MQKLTNTSIAAIKPPEKLYKIHDGNGLFLYVRPSGRKSWVVQFQNKASQKRSSITIGEYPELSISKARKLAIEQRVLLSNDAGLFAETKMSKTKQVATLNDVFKLWLERWRDTVSPSYALQTERALVANIMSVIGNRDVTGIKPIDIVDVLTPMEARGSLVYLSRTKQALGLVFDFAISRGICEFNPANTVKNNAFKSPDKKHFSFLTPKEMPHFLNVLANSEIQLVTKCCILFQLVTMTRPRETTSAEWAEIDLDENVWTIPKERMKANREHIVPLSTAAKMLLSKMQVLTRGRQYIFTGRKLTEAMNRETPRIALRRLKIHGIDTTSHGLRSLASTFLNETRQFRHDVIEAALAHVEENKTRAAYNHAEYLEERQEMLEYWGNEVFKYIDIETLQNPE